MLAEALVERTDIRRGAAGYLGRNAVGWGGARYSRGGERVVWLGHTGLITYPLVRFAAMVNARPQLSHLAGVAGRFRALAETAPGAFDAQWPSDSDTSGGHYAFERDAPLRMKAGGELPVLLWKLNGEEKYRVRAEGLARHFKAHLRVDPRGAYEWDYWYGAGLEVTRAREDISHGAIDVGFAVTAAGVSLVFKRADLERFALTLFRETGMENGVMQKPHDAVGRWLGLAKTNCEAYRAARPYLLGKAGHLHPQVLLGVAELAGRARGCETR